jgi:calcium-dependent protein kinase
VRLVSLRSDTTVKFAMKMIEKEKLKEKLYLLKRELEILASLDHPNIIKFHETYQDERYVYILMEHCSGGELLEKLIQKKSLKEKDAAKVIYSLLSALNYLHKKRICHRDLKLENLLFKDKSEDPPLKMIDFGLSVHMSDDHTHLHSKVSS